MTSLWVLVAVLVSLRIQRRTVWPWWLLLAPLWALAAAAVVLVVGFAVAMAVAWAWDEACGAREKLARARTTDRDWERWR